MLRLTGIECINAITPMSGLSIASRKTCWHPMAPCHPSAGEVVFRLAPASPTAKNEVQLHVISEAGTVAHVIASRTHRERRCAGNAAARSYAIMSGQYMS